MRASCPACSRLFIYRPCRSQPAPAAPLTTPRNTAWVAGFLQRAQAHWLGAGPQAAQTPLVS